jgi:hypothetical protein
MRSSLVTQRQCIHYVRHKIKQRMTTQTQEKKGATLLQKQTRAHASEFFHINVHGRPTWIKQKLQNAFNANGKSLHKNSNQETGSFSKAIHFFIFILLFESVLDVGSDLFIVRIIGCGSLRHCKRLKMCCAMRFVIENERSAFFLKR